MLAESARDVVAAVSTARTLGLRVTAQSTGHNAGPLGDLSDTVLVKTAPMRGVQIDPDRRIARAEAGAMWQDVTPAAAEYGLTALAGSARDVGVAGYTLGGGLSWLARSHGLAANSVVALEVVTADGELRRVDDDHDPELFWALRGGGGSFGIVTALEFRLYPVAEFQAGVLFWPIERAHDVLHAWREWLPAVPDRSRRSAGSCASRRCPTCRRTCAASRSSSSRSSASSTPSRPTRCSPPCARWSRRWTRSATTPPPGLALVHMDPDGPVPGRGDGMLLGRAAGGRPRQLRHRGGRCGLPAAVGRAAPARRRAHAGPAGRWRGQRAGRAVRAVRGRASRPTPRRRRS